ASGARDLPTADAAGPRRSRGTGSGVRLQHPQRPEPPRLPEDGLAPGRTTRRHGAATIAGLGGASDTPPHAVGPLPLPPPVRPGPLASAARLIRPQVPADLGAVPAHGGRPGPALLADPALVDLL